ncbi:MAG: competence/damage-inducible protein A [Eubacteriales bacterium]|nr:competence/damage-inducible protein A [Eubacteriales bacterium]
MIVELISVGTELLMGNIINTNAAYLAAACADLGYTLYHQAVIGDNVCRLKEQLALSRERADIIILTGGLGPTQDDITRETVADFLGLQLQPNEDVRAAIAAYFERSGAKTVVDSIWKQTLVPETAQVLPNTNGTAPGLICEAKNCTMILLPGPPNELYPMFERSVKPYLKSRNPYIFSSRMIKICGVGESVVEEQIKDLIEEQHNPTIAPYAKSGEVHLRVTAKATDEAEAKRLLAPVVEKITSRLAPHVFTTDEHISLEQTLIDEMAARRLTLTTVESCSGGRLAARLINVPGASTVLQQGLVTYSNESKIRLVGVDPEALAEFGAVSAQVAEMMAVGGRKQHRTDYAIAITGIAGPDGGTAEKPVGLVYIACATPNGVTVNKHRFNGNRDKVRDYATVFAMVLLRNELQQLP